MTQTIELLGAQHQDVLAHLAAVEAAMVTGDTPNFADFATYLTQEVAAHFTLEEQALFPAMARHLGSDRGPLAVMNAEHESFRALLSDLTRAVGKGDSTAQRERCVEIIALLRDHIDKEDHVLFPMALRLLSSAELAEVNACAATLKGAAPR